MCSTNLEFAPISSFINPSFWSKLSDIKLNDDKLNENEHQIWGYFSNINNKSSIPILEVNSTSFNSNFESQKIYIPFHGRILNLNTIEQFKEFGKSKFINGIGQELFKCIENGKALTSPSLLNQFFVLSFADLKKFHFYYWFAFPVPYNLSISINTLKDVTDEFTTSQLEELWDKYCELDNLQKPFFLLHIENNAENSALHVTLLRDISKLDERNYAKYYFVFYDLSLMKNCPGSTLRNYVILILHHCPFLQGKSAKFLSLQIKREDSKLTIAHSLILNLQLPVCQPSVSDFINKDPERSWVGWEKNERGKMGPRLSNMKSFLDPKELAESSVDLNLKLMKWRLLSNIDLEKVKLTKFLLLGSGTLGCSVARILLGWGSRHITFVDNSVVSYSNPVRQSLFTFEDSQKAKPKAFAAADNLRKIFPGVKSQSFELSIPMPGHPIGDNMLEQVKGDIEKLTNLIQEHDVIFLLMDSRESRWLPTLLGFHFNKTVINAALGFDSYLVMRHGVRVDQEEFQVRQHPSGFKSLKGNYLGCYFCNDVTAPGNSMKDRTLDQQCTVTRPGVSAIAGALAAELAISILQHKEGAKTPAFFKLGNVSTEKELDNQCILGIIPHSIRGHLSNFSQVQTATQRYKFCVACSEVVQEAYEKEGFEFLLEALQNSKYLEDITGLSALTKEAEDIGVWEFSDEEELQFTDYEEKKETIVSTKEQEIAEPERSGQTLELKNGSSETEKKCSILGRLFNKISYGKKRNHFMSCVSTNDGESAKSSITGSRQITDSANKFTERRSNQSTFEKIPDYTLDKKSALVRNNSPVHSTLPTENPNLTELYTYNNGRKEHEFNVNGEALEYHNSNSDLITLKSEICTYFSDSSQGLESDMKLAMISDSGSTLSNEIPVKILDNQSDVIYFKPKMNSSQSIQKSSSKIETKSMFQQTKEIFTLLARNIISSSESLTLDEISCGKYDTSSGKIITLAEVKDIFSSGSLTSESIKTDESVYYLANAESKNTFVP